MKPLKVLNVTSTRYGIGGVERLLLDLADKFDPAEIEFEYCNLFDDAGGDGAFPTALRSAGLKYHQVDGHRMSKVPSMALKLRKIIRDGAFDVVHLHMMKATIVGWLATRGSGVKAVGTRHYTRKLIAKHPAPIRLLDVQATKGLGAIIAISESVRKDLVAGGIREDKIRVVHNGIDLAAFDRSLEKAGLSNRWPGEFVIGSVGSLTKRKGHRYLIEAFAAIAGEPPNARLVIVGEGPEMVPLETLATELGVGDRVTLTGYDPNVPATLKRFDLYVHSATDEPFGIAILEAMAAGKFVIATSVDGVPEIVQNGITGRLIPSQDADMMAAAIQETGKDLDEVRQSAETARRRVVDKFDISRTAAGYAAIYKDVTI
jgi:glycosyltransferase involved in cell wall biosynthesis